MQARRGDEQPAVVAEWHDAGQQGFRRDFALRACGGTKAIGPADWQWLDASFELERLRILEFAPTVWLAGHASLQWEAGRLDLGVVDFVAVPVASLLRAQACVGVESYWIVENRATFERQARTLQPGSCWSGSVGAMWSAQGKAWAPHRMGIAEWQGTSQRWALNEHDRALLQRLLGRGDLHPELRELCEAMQREGRKAEQESWL